MKNVLIVKPSALGDIVQATCVLPALKSAFPGIRITWLTFEHNAEIVRDHPLIDGVISIRRKGGLLRTLPGLVRSLRDPEFDTIIDLQCLLRSAILSRLTGCARRIGFADGREQATLFYTEKYDIPVHAMHAVDRYLTLCERLGAALSIETTFPVPVRDAHRARISALLADFARGELLVAMCPTAKWQSKQWPAASFAAVADILAHRCNAKVVLLGSPSETEIVADVAARMTHECLDLSGRVSLMELAALFERADLFVGNDSGLMHLASATRTPTAAIFGPTDPARTGPYNPHARAIKLHLECMPCFKRACESLRCMKELTVQTVAGACEDILSQAWKRRENGRDRASLPR